MAVPKRKTSRGNTRHRRAQWKATAPRATSLATTAELRARLAAV
ncbi:50S ribosomal protein L32 [Kutzneria sp. 744]|nr:50S ribosomal protein L32 [Kutzneria sp. 744]EWM14194.1 50S ribosomal protein L32 [Kutzneria sp. 744]